MTILVTGAAGFIGFHTCLAKLKTNNVVIGVDNLNNYYDVKLKKDRLNILRKYKNFSFIKSDIQNVKLFTRFKKKRLMSLLI